MVKGQCITNTVILDSLHVAILDQTNSSLEQLLLFPHVNNDSIYTNLKLVRD